MLRESVECFLKLLLLLLDCFVVHKVNEAHYEYGSDMFVSKAKAMK